MAGWTGAEEKSKRDPMMVGFRARLLDHLLPIMLGLSAFLIVVPVDVLRFENIAWLMSEDDAAAHYLGWAFFRDAPWSLPLGSNPRYGIELASSIFYSDSIPLFAILFKVFSPILSGEFQYFGLWLLLCFILQACFAWRIAGLIDQDGLFKTFATLLLVLSPPMLYRMYAHDSLVAHWLILAALYLCLDAQSDNRWKWFWLCVVSSLVHSYLLAMVVLLWLSDLGGRFIAGQTRVKSIVTECILVFCGVFAALWQAGFFMVGNGKAGHGFGHYRMNVNSLFNPSLGFVEEEIWSYLLPGLPLGSGDYEGFNYLGLGVIFLLLVLLPSVARKIPGVRIGRRWLPLAIVCIGLVVFALSNKVGFGGTTVSLPVPDKLGQMANMLQSSGRMFWPVFYLIICGLLLVLSRHFRRNVAVCLLAVAVIAQAVDTSAGWAPRKNQIVSQKSTYDGPLRSKDWASIVVPYQKIRRIPPGRVGHFPKEIAYFAASHKLPTDAVYLARIDHQRRDQLLKYSEYVLLSGNYGPITKKKVVT